MIFARTDEYGKLFRCRWRCGSTDHWCRFIVARNTKLQFHSWMGCSSRETVHTTYHKKKRLWKQEARKWSGTVHVAKFCFSACPWHRCLLSIVLLTITIPLMFPVSTNARQYTIVFKVAPLSCKQTVLVRSTYMEHAMLPYLLVSYGSRHNCDRGCIQRGPKAQLGCSTEQMNNAWITAECGGVIAFRHGSSLRKPDILSGCFGIQRHTFQQCPS